MNLSKQFDRIVFWRKNLKPHCTVRAMIFIFHNTFLRRRQQFKYKQDLISLVFRRTYSKYVAMQNNYCIIERKTSNLIFTVIKLFIYNKITKFLNAILILFDNE